MSTPIPPTDLQRLFEQANALLARGEPRPALQLAQQAWSLAPENADCCNLVGVCAIALGERNMAEQCWLHAVALRPDAVEAHYNLAMHYADCQRSDDAERCFRQTLALAPVHAMHAIRAGAYARLGILLAESGRGGEAEHCYRQALDLSPGDAATHCNLGLLLAAQKHDTEAEQCYRQALALTPADSIIHSNLGILLARAKRVAEAEHCYRQAIALNPASAEAYANLGLLLESGKRMEEAEQCLREALRLNPHSAEIHSNLANLLTQLERTEEAEQAHRQSIALTPLSAAVHSSFGVLLARTYRDAEAEHQFRHAIALAPHYQLAHLNLAMLLLAHGKLTEGWGHYEARYHPDLPDPDAPMPAMPIAKWQGESLAGKSVLVWHEQGFGDMIQFCRYLPLLKERGAARITLVCQPALQSLMRTLDGVDTVLSVTSAPAAAAKTAHDYWTLPMSLPLHFHSGLSSIPVGIPYLHAPPERRAIWSQRLPPRLPPNIGTFRVGLVWKGNPLHANDAKRSLPGLATLAPLWEIGPLDGVQFVSLQYGVELGADEALHRPSAQNWMDLGSGIGDFADTAAILEQLDLLITVDTAAAHLAGALGKPCWVLLPAYRTDWRWLRERNDSPWYPHGMRLFRQANGQDWNAVVNEVALALRRHIL
jgi:Flp pilus assembly protein TadD